MFFQLIYTCSKLKLLSEYLGIQYVLESFIHLHEPETPNKQSQTNQSEIMNYYNHKVLLLDFYFVSYLT